MSDDASAEQPSSTFRSHALPRLPYGFDALEPHIDARTLQVHYRKHHYGYVNALNRGIAPHAELHGFSAEQLCRRLAAVPAPIRDTIRLNAGGHWNHSRMWAWMTPQAAGKPFGRSADAIVESFGTIETFRQHLLAASAGMCGSGWVWVITNASRLSIVTTPNEDNPVMNGEMPVLGLDLWEHAYYLKRHERRLDYVAAWWKVVNWAEVNRCLRSVAPGRGTYPATPSPIRRAR